MRKSHDIFWGGHIAYAASFIAMETGNLDAQSSLFGRPTMLRRPK